jgi:hypothetical protein
MSERIFRELTEIEQALVTSVILNHLNVEAVTKELARYHVDFMLLAGPERIRVKEASDD